VKSFKKFKKFLQRHQLASFVILAIVISAIMTVVSMWLYMASGTMKLDLSRPGYEQARQEITNDSSDNQSFSPNGSLTPSVINDFRDRLNKLQKKLGDMGNFDSNALSDGNLGLE